MPITTKFVSSIPTHGEMYSIQQYVIKFVSYLRQVGGFLRFPPPIQEEFEDTKGVIRIRILKKNRQHNGQKKKYKRTNNDLQNIKFEHEPH
jgi:hypothetical protein